MNLLALPREANPVFAVKKGQPDYFKMTANTASNCTIMFVLDCSNSSGCVFSVQIAKGAAIGYRRGASGGNWVRGDGRQNYQSIGAADDFRDADGLTVFAFAQAQARAWFASKARELAGHEEPQQGPYTIAMAVADDLAARERRGSKGVAKDRYAAESRIVPSLGSVEISKLTSHKIHDWLESLAAAPKLVRTGKLATKEAMANFDASDDDAVRARRSTANRLLTVLAALNHAFREGRVSADEPWRKVKPFREADAALIR